MPLTYMTPSSCRLGCSSRYSPLPLAAEHKLVMAASALLSVLVVVTEHSVTAAQQMSAVFRTQRIFKIIFELISATNTLQAVLVCDNGTAQPTHVSSVQSPRSSLRT